MRTYLSYTLIALMLLSFGILMADTICNHYGKMTSISPYEEITGGIVLSEYNDAKQCYTSLPIGFNFMYYNHPYTDFAVSSYGYITFSPTLDECCSALNEGSTNNVIAGLNTQLGRTPSAQLQYKTIGVAPNRILTIQYKGFKRPGTTENLNFQIRLHETTNIIDLHYGNGEYQDCPLWNYVHVGLRGADCLDIYNLHVVDDWWENTLGNTYNDACVLSSSVNPPSGFQISFLPNNPTPAPNIANLVYPENQAQNVSTLSHLAWSYSGPNIDGYFVSLGTDNPPTNILHNLEVTDPSLSLINYLHPSIQYYWRIVPFNGNGTPNDCPIWSFQTDMIYEGLSVPYYENVDVCQVNNLPSGWLAEDVDHNGCSWHMVNGIAATGMNSIMINCTDESVIDDWLISPPIMLEADTDYCFRAKVKSQLNSETSYLTVLWGNSPLTEDLQNSGNYTLWMVNSSDFTTYSYVVTPTEDGIYYFAIQAFSAGLCSDIWIDDIQVVDDAFSVVEELPIPRPRLGVVKNIFPNPVAASTTVEYELAKSENVILKLYNMRGQQVYSVDLGTKSSGSHANEMNLESLKLPAGIYHLKLQSGSDISHRKLMYLPK